MNEQPTRIEELVESHERRLLVFLRCRVDDSTARDLAQETWVDVWQHYDTYDPERGSFWVFTKIWANFVLKRYWRARKRGQDREVSVDEDDGSATLHDAAETGPGMEDVLTASEAFLELLCCAASCDRPPNEIIVFGLAKTKWKPSEIVAHFSASSLNDMQAVLEREYLAMVPHPGVEEAFSPLREKLNHPLGQTVRDPRVRRSYSKTLEVNAGQSKLSEYFPAGSGPEEAVSRWVAAVKRAVVAQVRQSGRGPLFHWAFEDACRRRHGKKEEGAEI